MKLEIPVKVYFDDVQGMVNEVKGLQTYKLFEGDDMVLVDLNNVVSIMVNHIRATDNYSGSPNGWIPCSKKLPEDGEEVFVYLFNPKSPYIAWVEDGHWYTEEFEVNKEYEPLAWMPLLKPYGGEQE